MKQNQQETTPSQKLDVFLYSNEPIGEIHDFLNCSLSDGYFSIHASRKNIEKNERINNSVDSKQQPLERLDSTPNSPMNKLIYTVQTKKTQEHQQSQSLIQYFHIKKFINKMSWRKKLNALFNEYHYNILNDKGSQLNLKLFRDNTLNLKPMLSQFQQNQFKQKKRQLFNYFKKLYKRTCKKIQALSLKIEQEIDKIPLISPEARWKITWDCLVMVARLYYLFLIPIDLAWRDIPFLFGFLYGYSVSLLLLLIIDFLISFNNAFYQFGQIVNERSKIMLHVVSKSYGLETISLLILIIYAVINSQDTKQIDFTKEWYDLSMLLYYCQCRSIPKLIAQVEEVLNLSKPSSSMLELLKLLIVLFFVLHCYTCLWYFVGQYSIEQDFKGSWLVSQGIQSESWQIQYLYSFYFSTVTMFTIGYGDVIPVSYLERLIAILYMMICSIQLSYSVSTVGAIIDKISAYSQEKMRKVHTINTYMQNKKISYELQYQVREYLNYYWQAQSSLENDEEQEIISQLSENLREQLMIDANSRMLNQCALFKEYFSDGLKKKLVKKIKQIVIQPENIIDFDSFFPALPNNQLFICFVEQGEIEIFIQNDSKDLINENPQISVVSKMNKGGSLGIVSFISGIQSPERYRSIGFTKLLLLSREDFLKILPDFPEDYERFRNLHDALIYNETTFLNLKCFSCNSSAHRVIQCPLLHYIPDKELIIKRHQFSTIQPRLEKFKRNASRQRSLFAARADLETLQTYSLNFMNENWKWAEFYEEPPEEEEVPMLKSEATEPEQQQQQQQQQQQKRIDKKKLSLVNFEQVEETLNQKKVQFQVPELAPAPTPTTNTVTAPRPSGRKLRPSCTIEIYELKRKTALKKFKKVVGLIKSINHMKKKKQNKATPNNKILNLFLEALQNQSIMKNQLSKVKIRLKQIEDGKKQILNEGEVEDVRLLKIRMEMLIRLYQELTKQELQINMDTCKEFKYYQPQNNLENILHRVRFYKQQIARDNGIPELQHRLIRYMMFPQIYFEKYKYAPYIEKQQSKSKSVIEKLEEQQQQQQEDQISLTSLMVRKSKMMRKSFRNQKTAQIRPDVVRYQSHTQFH